MIGDRHRGGTLARSWASALGGAIAALALVAAMPATAADTIRIAAQKTGTDNLPGPVDYSQLDAVPAVIRRNRASTVEALQQSGVDKYDIPAFLRKQAD